MGPSTCGHTINQPYPTLFQRFSSPHNPIIKLILTTLAAALLAPIAATSTLSKAAPSTTAVLPLLPTDSSSSTALPTVATSTIIYLPVFAGGCERWKERCALQGCAGDPTELEFNNGMGRYTIYKNRDYGPFTTDDKKVGQCNVDKSDHFQCSNPFSQAGDSIVFCKADFKCR